MDLKPALSTEAQVDQLMAFIWSFLFTCYHSNLKKIYNNNKNIVPVVSLHHGKLGQAVRWHKSMQLHGGQWNYLDLHQLKAHPFRQVCVLSLALSRSPKSTFRWH